MKLKIFLFFLIILFPLKVIISQVVEKSFILIDANSRVDVPAKEITFSIGLIKTDSSAEKAYRGLKEIEKKFIEILDKFNVPDSNVSYSLSNFRKDGGYQKRPLQFRASENIVVKLYDFSQYEPFQLALISAGIYSFSGSFSTTDVAEARELGFKKALEKAKREAKIISENIGRELGNIIEVESNNRDYAINNGGATYFTATEKTLVDIPQYIALNTRLKVKFALK